MKIGRSRREGADGVRYLFFRGYLFGATPDVSNFVACGKWIVGIEDVLGDAGDPGASADRGDYGGVGADTRSGDQASGESGAENSFVHKILMQGQLAFGVERGHFCRGARAAGRAIERAGP